MSTVAPGGYPSGQSHPQFTQQRYQNLQQVTDHDVQAIRLQLRSLFTKLQQVEQSVNSGDVGPVKSLVYSCIPDISSLAKRINVITRNERKIRRWESREETVQPGQVQPSFTGGEQFSQLPDDLNTLRNMQGQIQRKMRQLNTTRRVGRAA